MHRIYLSRHFFIMVHNVSDSEKEKNKNHFRITGIKNHFLKKELAVTD